MRFLKISLPAIFILLLMKGATLSWAGKLEDLDDLKRIQENNSRILAETSQQVSSLRQEVQELRGVVDELKHFFQEESQKSEKLLREFDFRITGMEEKIFIHNSQLQDLLVPPGPSGKGKVKVTAEEESAYKKALSEVNLQNYKSATAILDKFLKKYPKSVLADNAYYWKGEILYAEKDFQNAILAFQQVVKLFPKSDKVPAAVLKQGYSFFERKEYADAQAFLQKVVTDYASSDEAGLAKEKLAQIAKILSQPPSKQPTPRDSVPSTPPVTTPAPTL